MISYKDELYHHGIKGQKWGVRRYQNEDGSLTAAGQKRYGVDKLDSSSRKSYSNEKKRNKAARKELRKLYRKIDRRTAADEYNADYEKNKRAIDRQQSRDEQYTQDLITRKTQEAEQRRFDETFGETRNTDEKWWLSDEEKAIEKSAAEQAERQRAEIEAYKNSVRAKQLAKSDMDFDRRNEKQYQEEIKKIRSGRDEAKKMVDKYISDKYGLSSKRVSDLKTKKNYSQMVRELPVMNLSIDVLHTKNHS